MAGKPPAEILHALKLLPGSALGELVAEVAATPAVGSTGNELVPYSLRHAYADRADRIGMTDKEAALQMGHSVQTHNAHYTGTGADTAARALAKARAAARNRTLLEVQ